MKRLLRFLVCFAVSFCSLWVIGYGNLMNNLEGSLPALIYLGSTFILSVVFILFWELYLYSKKKIDELNICVEELEIDKLKKKD